jgi:hypothetical protein
MPATLVLTPECCGTSTWIGKGCFLSGSGVQKVLGLVASKRDDAGMGVISYFPNAVLE